MANRFWVGGSGTWDASTTTQWSTTSGGAGGASVPGVADVAIFDSLSNVAGGGASYVVTRTATASLVGLQMAKPSAASATVTLAGSTSFTLLGTGLSLTSAAEVVWTNTGPISFTANTSTCKTGGVLITSAVSVSTGVTVSLSGDFFTTAAVTFNGSGVINPNNFVLKCSNAAIGTSTSRTINFGTGYFEFTGLSGTFPSTGPTSWASITGTQKFVLSGSSGSSDTRTIRADYFNNASVYTKVDVTAGVGTVNFGSYTSVGDLNFTGFGGTVAFGPDQFGAPSLRGNLTIPAGVSVTGTPDMEGIAGTQTITTAVALPSLRIGSQGYVATVTFAQATTVTGQTTFEGASIDLGGFDFTTDTFRSTFGSRFIAFGTKRIKVSGTNGQVLNMNSLSGFSYTGTGGLELTAAAVTPSRIVQLGDGGGAGASVAMNLWVTAGTAQVDIRGCCKNLDLTGFSGSIIFGSDLSVYGSYTWSASATYDDSAFGSLIFNTALTSITPDFKSIPPKASIEIDGTQSVILAGSLTLAYPYTVTLTGGTLNLASYNITASAFLSNNSFTRAITFGTGKITLIGQFNDILIDCENVTNFTWTGSGLFEDASNSTTYDKYIRFGSSAGLTSANAINVSIINGGGSTTAYFYGGFNNLDFTGYTGNVYMVNTLTVYGNLLFGPSTQFNSTKYNTILFASTSGTKTIDVKGRTFDGAVTFNGVGGTWQLASNMGVGSESQTTFTNGTLRLAGYTLTTGIFDSNNSNTRTIDFGTTGSIAINGYSIYIMTVNGTNLTFLNVGKISVAPYYWSNSYNQIAMSAPTSSVPDIYIAAGSYGVQVGSTLYCRNFSVDPGYTAPFLYASNSTLYARGNVDLTNVSVTSGPGLSISSVPNAAGTYTISLRSSQTYSNFSFQPTVSGVTTRLATVGGTAAFVNGVNLTGAGAGTTFDMQNNVVSAEQDNFVINASTGLTLAMGTGYFTQNNTQNSQNILTITNGANFTVTGSRRLDTTGTLFRGISTSGVTSANAFDVNVSGSGSFGCSGFTDRVNNLNFTGMTGSFNVLGGSSLTVSGSLTMAAGMTVTCDDTTSINMYSPSGSYTVTTAGVAMPTMYFGTGTDTATWTLQDAFTSKVPTGGSIGIFLVGGTLNTSNNTVTVSYLDVSNNNVATLNLGSSTVNVRNTTATEAQLLISASANVTLNSGTSNIVFSGTSNKRFEGGGKAYYRLTQASASRIQMFGNNSFNDILNTSTAATEIQIVSSSTQTLANFSASGGAGRVLTLKPISTLTPFTLSKASGVVNVSYTSITASTATGGATWLAYYKNGNVNGGYDTGWRFSDGSESFFDIF